MTWPPVVPGLRPSLYFVPKRSGAPAVPLAEGAASEPAGADAAGGGDAVVAVGLLAAGWQAANTIAVLAIKPRKRLSMNSPPFSVRGTLPVADRQFVARRPVVAHFPKGQPCMEWVNSKGSRERPVSL